MLSVVKKDSSKGALPLGKSSAKDHSDKTLGDSDQDTRRVVVDSGGDTAPPAKKKDRMKEYQEREKEMEKSHQSPHDSEKVKEGGKKEEEDEDDEMGENDSEGDTDSDSESSDSGRL